MNGLEFILAGMLTAATPFLLAALGELVVERSGVLSLGIEGMMALAAAVAFITTYSIGHHGLGFLFAALTGIAIALLFCRAFTELCRQSSRCRFGRGSTGVGLVFAVWKQLRESGGHGSA